jgi:HD-like signal output (HDOD) protein
MTQEISDEKFKKLLKGIHIPPQPQIMVDLQMEMLMPDVSIDHLSKIITLKIRETER